MEVVTPVADFHFESTCSTPFMNAPSSPKAFGDVYSFYSAPTSPSRSSTFYNPSWEDEHKRSSSSAADAAAADEEDDVEGQDYDFAFDFSGSLEMPPLTAAEELFDHGKIRPLRPLSAAKTREPRRSPGRTRERGRERAVAALSSAPRSTRREARSLSPLRCSDASKASAFSSSSGSSAGSLKGSSGRKWRLRDLLLFRSASEGRATEKDTLRKYGMLPPARKVAGDDVKNASFRSTDSSSSVSGSRRGRVSAHELHYTANRAVSEEMKRKTFLPYKQGLLACLGFNPTFHGLGRGFDPFRRG